MKKILTFISILFMTTIAHAQMLHPVKWKFTSENNQQELMLKFSADIEQGWHIYSQYTPDGGPLPMLFTFENNSCYSLVEKVIEPKQIEEFDSIFAINVKYLMGTPTLSQKIKINSSPCKISGRIEYQACKDACIPLDTTFSIMINK